jgi:hypothetical protein
MNRNQEFWERGDLTPPHDQAAIDRTAFPGTPADYFWASSPCADAPADGWIVDFGDGTAGCGSGGGEHYARCVR